MCPWASIIPSWYVLREAGTRAVPASRNFYHHVIPAVWEFSTRDGDHHS